METEELSGFDPTDERPLPYRRLRGALLSSTEAGYFLKAPNGPLLVLGDEERFLWNLLDQQLSFAEIAGRFTAHFGSRLAPASFASFLNELIDASAIERAVVEADEPARPRPVSLPGQTTPKIRKVALTLDGVASAPIGNGDATAALLADDEVRAAIPSNRGRGRLGGRKREGGLRYALSQIWHVNIGNPDPLFRALSGVFWPNRYLSWLLIPLTFAALKITIRYWPNWLEDWKTIIHSIPQWPCLWLAEHFTTWTGKMLEGAVIYGFGGEIKRFEIKFFMGLFIRCHFEETNIASLPRSARLWAGGATLLWRLFCWAFGTVLWIMLRPTRPIVADLAFFEAFMGLASFVCCCCPLFPLYGYKFLEIVFHQEHLHGRSLRLLALTLKGHPAPDVMSTAERWVLIAASIGLPIFFTAFIAHMLYQADVWTINNMAGLGAWIAILHMTGLVIYFYKVWKLAKQHRERREAGASAA